MTFASNFHMPGAFHFEQPQPPSGVHPGIFRPPISPSASSSVYVTKSTASLQSETPSATGTAAGASRKRPRDHDREATPLNEWADTTMNLAGAAGGRGGVAPSLATTPAALSGKLGGVGGEPRYVLAGQIETPGGGPNPHLGENGILDDSMYSDVDYRRDLGSKRGPDETESPAGRHTSLIRPQQSPADGWSRLAFHTIGGVVGKMWEFCRDGAFRGFFAGGGKGYAIQGSPSSAQRRSLQGRRRSSSGGSGGGWFNEQGDPTLSASDMVPSVPGTFPDAEAYEPAAFATPDPTPTRPAAKRRQISENDELRRNWVMVDEMATASERRKRPSTTLTRRQSSRGVGLSATGAAGRRISVPVSRLGPSPGLPRRHSHRISHAGSPGLTAHEPASFAAPRSPRASSPAISSASRLPVPSSRPGSSRGGPNPFAASASSSQPPPSHPRRSGAVPSPMNAAFASSSAPADSPHRRSGSGASAASARVVRGGGRDAREALEGDIEASPRLDPEAKQLAARRLREERDADARIATLNARLREMIRQGKEALGTTIEVDGGEGGWEDD